MAARWWFWLILLHGPWLIADDTSLVRVGDSWSYFCGSNAPSSPITAWRQAGFDDSAWARGPSGFSTSFVADFREATLWPEANGYHSVFLRRTFSVSDPSSVKWLVLRLDYDDGFVAYLNGQEIVRRGLTNDPVGFNDFAAPHPGGAAEEFDVSASLNLLQRGANLLAIEVHAAVTNEPGNINSMRLVPELLANFQRGPFLQNATSNSIQVIWRTPVTSDGAVDYGTTPDLGSEIADPTRTTNHVFTLTGLQPDTQYFYCVRTVSRGVQVVSPTNSFRTLKTAGDVTFLVMGDGGNGSVPAYQVAAAMRQSAGDLVMHVGDIVYPNFTFGLEDTRCLSVYGQQMRSVPFFFAMGNHELEGGALGTAYFATFSLPTNSVFGTEHFYSFDHGDAHLVVLFLPSMQSFPGFEQYELHEGSTQYQWLTNDLAASGKPWKFLFLHHPLAGSGSHHTDLYNGSSLYDWQVVQNMLIPVARQYGVQMVFSGHDHDYERFNPIQGVQLIVTGASGSYMSGIQDERDASSSQFYTVPEFIRVSIQGNSLHCEAVGTNAQPFDELFIERTPPAPQLYSAASNTPLVESRPADDGHGNLNGQTFGFIGDPIPTFPGDYSNLGRVYVNNDSTNLFVGLKQAMFGSSNNIFLFIESPRLAGVSNLVGLGDGLANSSQGVDGLDFLENLSFTNFAPAIACVLGDEFADGQFRNFVRPGLPLNLGQGVFHLDATFSDVSGVKIQQFNRSPQALDPYVVSYPEQNANFIEVAIPLVQLGGLRPGDTMKIAAVIGLDGYNTNAQTRQLDTAFLGSSMTGSGQSNVLLEALSVRVAPGGVLTVKADDLARSYAATNPPLTVTYSGFFPGDDPAVLSGAPVLSTSADTNSTVGNYPIQVDPGTLSHSNYTFLCVDGTLTVTQALLTASADNCSRLYGATNPPFSGTVLGVQNADVITAAFSSAATPATWVGQYAIVPALSGAALSNYCVATNLGTLTITPSPLSVTADDKSRPYGAADPIFTGTLLGLLNNDAIVPSFTTTAGPTSPIGVYSIVPALSGGALVNYLPTTNLGVLTVTAAPLTAKADDQMRPYGRTNAPLTVSYLGFVNGQGANIVAGAPELSTIADTNSSVGVYPITLSPGTLSVTDTNYTLGFMDGALTVTQAVLAVRADDQTRVYGNTNPPFTVSFSGFVNGQGTDILSGNVVLSTTADTNSPAGPWPITVSPGTLAVANTNYTLQFINGTLLITPAASSILLSSSLNPCASGTPVTLTATVGPLPPASSVPGGTVAFLENGKALGAAALSNGVAAFGWVPLTLGTNEVRAEYNGDNNFLQSTNTLSQVVVFPCSSTNYVLSLVQTETNTLLFTFLGTTNAQYFVLQGTNLDQTTTWTVLPDSTNTALNGLWGYTLTNSPGKDNPTAGAVRFFRAQAVQPCP